MDEKEILFKEFIKVYEELKSLIEIKYGDYGEKQLLEFGDYGILIRSNDKMERLKNIYKTKRIKDKTFMLKLKLILFNLLRSLRINNFLVINRPRIINFKEEKLEDTWIDLAGYALWAIAVRRYLHK